MAIALAVLVAASVPGAAAGADAVPLVRSRGEPVFRFELGMPITWRDADVTSSGAVPIEYRTGTPYLGFLLDARVAPLRAWWAGHLPSWSEPLEIDLHYSQRFLSSELNPANAGGSRSIGSGEQRFSADLRYPWLVGGRTRLAGRLGYGLHRFTIDENALLPSSSRSGVLLGVDAEHRFFPWASAELAARIYPGWSPGTDERAKFGADGSGWGYELVLGASGPLPLATPGFGWRVAYDFLHFSDSFSGSGADVSAASSYQSVILSVTFEH